MQQLYDQYTHPPSEIESEFQRQILQQHGLCRCWLPSYWQTSYRYPLHSSKEAEAIRNTTVWLRFYERYIEDEQVPIKIGEQVPDVPLICLHDQNTTGLHKLIGTDRGGDGRPLIVVAGSSS